MGDSSQLASIKDLFNKISGNKKFHFRRQWNYIQRNFKMEDLVVIDFKHSKFRENYWRCYFDNKHELYEARKRSNASLESSFFGGRISDIEGIFSTAIKNQKWIGYFMPRPQWTEEKIHQSEKTINKLQLFKKYFDFRPFLKDVFKQNPSIETNEARILNTIWLYGLRYKEYLANTRQDSKIDQDFQDLWYTAIFDLKNFSKLLPSEQLTSLMFISYESIYSVEISKLLSTLVKESSLDVELYFSKYKDLFLSTDSVAKEKLQEALDEFIAISMQDKYQFYLEELLLNNSRRSFLARFPGEIRAYFKPKGDSFVSNAIQSIIGRMNILDRVNKMITLDKVNRSELSPPSIVTYRKDGIKWSEITIQEELLKCKSKYITTHEVKRLDEIILEQWQNHLINLGNSVTCPFFRVAKSSNRLYFKWNTMEHAKERKYVADYRSKQVREREEDGLLSKHIQFLKQAHDIEYAIEYARGVRPFSFQHIQKRWETELRAALDDIKRRYAKRIRRMREFGILLGKQKPTKDMHVYLDEILAVEEEVKPYLTFVKNAFQSALPVRKITFFDEYRNNHVGVEFDPETVFDQNKWQRGEVMKILKRKKVFGNVQQVNTFCLDFSGSMTHVRMRNLFKILYLIVTGLEDRKIYNSIHFFSSKFIPSVEFSLRYVDRKILFKILTQISRIADNRVVYGGVGGTNISDGLEKCYQRIITFSDEIYSKKKEEGITKSIFVISDGEPTLGVMDIPDLAEIIRNMRREGDVSIKGIYIKPENDTSDFIPQMFGEGNYVENTSFEEGVKNFVSIMTKTFEMQRKEFKNKKRVKKVFGARGAKK